MPAAMTYDSLLTDVCSYMERPNEPALLAQLPRLVMLAENRLATDLKILGVEEVVSGTFTVGNDTLPKPAYWRNTTSFNFTDANGARKPIWLRQYEFCRGYWPNTSETGEPRYFADYNYDNFLIVPPPSAAFAFELLYEARLAPLDPTHQTNWFTRNAPQLLLYATILETQMWLKNFQAAGTWATNYSNALQGFNIEDAQRATDRAIVKT